MPRSLMAHLSAGYYPARIDQNGQAMYEQNCKDFNRLRYKQHSKIAMLLTSWSFFARKALW